MAFREYPFRHIRWWHKPLLWFRPAYYVYGDGGVVLTVKFWRGTMFVLYYADGSALPTDEETPGADDAG